MTMEIPNADFHEVWWIYAAGDEPWAGLRIAHFRMTINGTLIFLIAHETPERTGPRIWDDVSAREGWIKIEQIPIPTAEKVKAKVLPC